MIRNKYYVRIMPRYDVPEWRRRKRAIWFCTTRNLSGVRVAFMTRRCGLHARREFRGSDY